MKTKGKISAYILRGAAAALLISCVIVALSSAISLPNKRATVPAPPNDTAFGKNAQENAASAAASAIRTKCTLTFADRVAYQRAIEEVYWRHRIWPAANAGPKPPLVNVMSQAEIEKRVGDYLRNSQALEDYWQRPITPDQLQAEIERIASHTKQPGVLREIFAVLGNDPFVIAECLARPVLAERLLTELYAHDQRFHSDLNRAAEAELRKPYGEIPVVQLSSLREKDARYCATGTLNSGKDRLKLATTAWLKEPLRSWLATAETQVPITMAAVSTNYTLPMIAGPSGVCADNWTATSTAGAPDGRDFHTGVWTGTEMIVWGGWNGGPLLDTGGRYNPSTDSWTATSTIAAPDGREIHTAVWTGSEMIVWGGSSDVSFLNTGGRYNPSTDSWTAISTIAAPDGRIWHTAVWTGSEMIVWGGTVYASTFDTGGRYNPSSDSWTATSTSGAPTGRHFHTAVWTGGEMIVWGGFDFNYNTLNTGGRYNPGTNSWTPTSTASAPAGRERHTAVWSGNEMIVWGGSPDQGSTALNTGGRYNPGTNSWTATAITNAPVARFSQTAVWTGSQMIVWGGTADNIKFFNTGARYHPSTDSWTPTSTVGAPVARDDQAAVWSGTEMIVWGGYPGFLNTGGRYCAQSPTPTSTPVPSPTARPRPSYPPRRTPPPRPFLTRPG